MGHGAGSRCFEASPAGSTLCHRPVTRIAPYDTMTDSESDESRPVRRYRALFISDVHLGTKGCQSQLLLDFLREVDADTIYLVGDIVDGWRLKANWYWPQEHNDV